MREGTRFVTRSEYQSSAPPLPSRFATASIVPLNKSQSSPRRYLLEEHLLERPSARPDLRALLSKPQDLLGTDEFELFPHPVRPQNLCAIVGGVGARSFLHSDPMEWMGWNVLLEGRKVWTFLPPLPDLDASLGTYRLEPNAFGSYNVSAGWQSNVDLYQRGSTTAVDGSTCASWPVEGEGCEVMQHAVSGVQEVGDLVLIPPRHWHQVRLWSTRTVALTGLLSCSVLDQLPHQTAASSALARLASSRRFLLPRLQHQITQKIIGECTAQNTKRFRMAVLASTYLSNRVCPIQYRQYQHD